VSYEVGERHIGVPSGKGAIISDSVKCLAVLYSLALKIRYNPPELWAISGLYYRALLYSFNVWEVSTMHRAFVFALVSLLALPIFAADGPKGPIVYPFGWQDKNHFKSQRLLIEDVARSKLGTQVHGNRDDLVLLQRIVHKGLFKKEQRLENQAMGVILGDLLEKELGLVWQIYEDSVGRSRALCVADTMNCLYPVTMISRRIEVGLMPNVQEIYDYAVETITPYIPKVDVYGVKVKP